jgi:hypothetical protein
MRPFEFDYKSNVETGRSREECPVILATKESLRAMPLVNRGRAMFQLYKLDCPSSGVRRKGLAKAKQTCDEVPLREGLLLVAGIYRGRGTLTGLAASSQKRASFEHTLPRRHRLFAGLAVLERQVASIWIREFCRPSQSVGKGPS